MQPPVNLDVVRTPLYHFPAADTAAIVTIAALAGKVHVIDVIHWSFDADPAAAKSLTVVIGGTTVFHVEIIKGGPGFLPFPGGLYGDANEAAVVTLAADNAGAKGKVNVITR